MRGASWVTLWTGAMPFFYILLISREIINLRNIIIGTASHPKYLICCGSNLHRGSLFYIFTYFERNNQSEKHYILNCITFQISNVLWNWFAVRTSFLYLYNILGEIIDPRNVEIIDPRNLIRFLCFSDRRYYG